MTRLRKGGVSELHFTRWRIRKQCASFDVFAEHFERGTIAYGLLYFAI